MDHVAIMKKSWGLTEKILSGKKTIESRWYSSRRAPWDRIKQGDTVYFKNSGEPVKVSARVVKVMQFDDLDSRKVGKILEKYGEMDGIEKSRTGYFYRLFKSKKYCMLIFLEDVRSVEPFDVDKRGFGAMSAWVVVPDISRIRKEGARTRHVGKVRSPGRAG